MNYMTVNEFIQWVGGYYVPYNRVQEMEVKHYLSKFSGEFIERLKEEVKYSFSGQYKTPPDVAILVKNSQRAHEWLKLHKVHPKLIEEGEVDCSAEIEKLKQAIKGKKNYRYENNC